MKRSVPESRIRRANASPIRRAGRYVLYWMIAARRTAWNFALDRAAELAREHDRPLLVLEPLRCGYRWAGDRLHRFVIEGMMDQRAALRSTAIRYYPYLEPEAGAGKGLLEALAARACAVVTDDSPAFFLPRAVSAAAARLDVRLEAVDSNGLLPLRAAERVFVSAYSFRRFLQKELPPHLGEVPGRRAPAKLAGPAEIPAAVRRRWPEARLDEPLSRFPIDHAVAPAPFRGGSAAAGRALRTFLRRRLDRYGEEAKHPDAEATSGLSPYLHFGHVSPHEVFRAVAKASGWTERRVRNRADGRRGGWGVDASTEAFLDQLVTWRELGFNMAAHREGYDRYDALPAWARATLADHEKDRRDPIYDLEDLEAARTHDRVWNAAQTELVRDGRLHNYLRMLWGKKILEWSPSPRRALEVMTGLNDKYAVDGRDPNSVGGIFWVLGRYDRPWGPERRVFGKIRYMSSEATLRKLRLMDYLSRYAL